ncbi:ferrochelatase [Lichenifustis flavocetrariae]|uniref:Ferrochelatase n=1 Tax=Lichenifustis flavocetrariae TaxID=2949735 RepID=A0AA42CMJ0_9HYPH|nr:ferrochelatase [Lichenifustis flavocetrariae]MCW6511641.1 ferrochelatase [Lichenifustis flavocetrariae]
MATGPLPSGHPIVKPRKIGVLLSNLGTPDATDYWSMRRYLAEFLSDKRVIEAPRALWWVILNGIILTTRPGRKGKDYETIWNRELNESPLKTITRSQSDKLGSAVRSGLLGPEAADAVAVDWGMRYGNPSVRSALERLQAQGCDRILLVPLYPQYAAATTATACDKVFEALMAMRWQPALRVAPPYHDDPAYIDALAVSLREGLAALDFEPEVVIASFHGVPKDYLLKGDPYHCQCAKTARLLREAMGMTTDTFRLTFQSRFGRAEWLQPYTDETIKALAKRGVKRLAVITPGFSADCLETIEEIGGENAEYFHHGGGEKFARIPCLNDSAGGMAVIEAIVKRELMGWV